VSGGCTAGKHLLRTLVVPIIISMMMTTEIELEMLLYLLFSYLVQPLPRGGFVQYHIVSKDCQQRAAV